MRLQLVAIDPAPLLREARSELESARSLADRATAYCAGMQSGMPSAVSAANSAISDANDAIRLLRQAGASTSHVDRAVAVLRDGIARAADYLANPDEAYRAMQAQNEFRQASNILATAASSL